MKQIYTVFVVGEARYHGIRAEDALETIIAATQDGACTIEVQRAPWPHELTIKVTTKELVDPRC